MEKSQIQIIEKLAKLIKRNTSKSKTTTSRKTISKKIIILILKYLL